MQRLEEAEKRRSDEKARRIIEEQRNLQRAQQAAEKLAARAFSQSYLSQMLPNVFQSLEKHGYIHDSVEQQISQKFLPWLTEKVVADLKLQTTSRLLVDGKIDNSNLDLSRYHFQCNHEKGSINSLAAECTFLLSSKV